MFPFTALSSEASAADLLEQVRWRDGLQCPRCRSSSVIKYGSYRAFQRYLCKDCDRTFNDKTRTHIQRQDPYDLRAREDRAQRVALYGSTRLSGSTPVFANSQLNSISRTRRPTGVSSASPKRSTRHRSNCVALLRWMNCTSQPDLRAASATARRARVVSLRAGVEPMKATSRRCSPSLAGELGAGTSFRRNRRTNRRFDSFSRSARRSLYRSTPMGFGRTTR